MPNEVQPAPEVDLSHVDEVVARLGHDTDQALPILQQLQNHYRWLPEAALRGLP